MGNQDSRRASTEIDDAYTRLLGKIESIEVDVHHLARQRGVKVQGLRTIIDDANPALLHHLASDRYRAIRAELRRPTN